jgi:hypothetical protein
VRCGELSRFLNASSPVSAGFSLELSRGSVGSSVELPRGFVGSSLELPCGQVGTSLQLPCGFVGSFLELARVCGSSPVPQKKKASEKHHLRSPVHLKIVNKVSPAVHLVTFARVPHLHNASLSSHHPLQSILTIGSPVHLSTTNIFTTKAFTSIVSLERCMRCIEVRGDDVR